MFATEYERSTLSRLIPLFGSWCLRYLVSGSCQARLAPWWPRNVHCERPRPLSSLTFWADALPALSRRDCALAAAIVDELARDIPGLHRFVALTGGIGFPYRQRLRPARMAAPACFMETKPGSPVASRGVGSAWFLVLWMTRPLSSSPIPTSQERLGHGVEVRTPRCVCFHRFANTS